MAAPVPIDAVVLSPSDLYRCAWKSLLESSAFVSSVMTAAAVAEIMLPGEDSHPTTILVDTPGSEHRIARQLGHYYQWYHALFVVNDYQLSTILPLFKLGVTGFMARDDSITNFMPAFIATAKGQLGLPTNVANSAVAKLAKRDRRHLALPDDLTRRESEVLQLVAVGKSNRDIAQSLFLSVRTVEAHLHNLYGKLDVKTRTEAALWAVRNGYATSI